MNLLNKRHRIGTIEKILNIRTELDIKDYKDSLRSSFKVFRFEGNSYVYRGCHTKRHLINEANEMIRSQSND